MKNYTATVFVLGGLPVTFDFSIAPAERDTGYSGGVYNWEPVAISGKRKRRLDWLVSRIENTPGEVDRLYDELLATAEAQAEDAAWSRAEARAESRAGL